jgi:hypothetical protein
VPSRSADPYRGCEAARRCLRPAAGISCRAMNRFGFDLPPQDVRWAVAEGVSQDVIAAVLLLHERPVDEIAPKLSTAELEKVIVLVGRSPRLYPLGIVEALERRRRPAAPVPQAFSLPSAKRAPVASESGTHPTRRHASRMGPDAQQSPERGKGGQPYPTPPQTWANGPQPS